MLSIFTLETPQIEGVLCFGVVFSLFSESCFVAFENRILIYRQKAIQLCGKLIHS